MEASTYRGGLRSVAARAAALAGAVLIALVLVLVPAKQAAAATSGDYEYTASYGYATITSYNGSSSTVSIPSKLGGYPVYDIGKSAFADHTEIVTLTIPDTVRYIEPSAFSGCTGLTSLTLPESIRQVRAYAFENCTALTSITINAESMIYSGYSTGSGAKLYGIFQNAGSKGSGITVTFGSTCTEIDDYLFYVSDSDEAPNITKVVIGSNVTEIGTDAFYNLSTLTSVTMKGSVVETIGAGAFKYCTSLGNVTFPSSLTNIKYSAFEGCTSITSVTLPKGLEKLGAFAYKDCTALKTVKINSKDLYTGAKNNTYYGGSFQNAGTATSGITMTFSNTCTSFPAGLFYGSGTQPNIAKLVISYKTDDIATGFINYLGTVTIYGYKGSPAWEYYQEYKDTYGFTWKTKAYDASDLTVTLSTSTYTYNGKVRKPTVTVKAGSIKLSSSYYTVSYASGRKAVGKYKVTVKGDGTAISGSTSVYFKIKPKTVSVKSVKSSATKKATVKWTKLSSANVTKYQIRYRVKGTSTWKKVTVSSSKSSYTLTGLKSGKTYQIQVRAYKTRSGTNYVGSWSSTKTVTVK